MTKKVKNYTDDFKLMIIDLYLSDKSINDICNEFELDRHTIFLWVKDFKDQLPIYDKVITFKQLQKLHQDMIKQNDKIEILKKVKEVFDKK